MKKRSTIFYALALAAMSGLYFAGCTQTDTVATPPGAPGMLMAQSVNATTIALMWTRGTGDAGMDTVYQGATVLGPVSGSAMNVTSLQEQTAYTFTVRTAGGTTNAVIWMTAERTNGLRIYETSDPSTSDPSGISVGPTIATTINLANGASADFILESYSGDPMLPSGISLVASNVHNAAWRDTKVNGKALYVPGGLNSNFAMTDYKTSMDTITMNAFDVPDDATYATKGSAIIVVKTSDNHLALVEIVPDASGKLYSVSNGHKYITVNVSYQAAVNTGYASRPHTSQPVGPVVRRSAR